MSSYVLYQTLVTAQGDGTALASSAVETSIIPAAAKYTLAQNFFSNLGQRLWLRAHGRISTLVTTPGTLAFNIKFGSTAVFSGGNMTLNTTAQSNTPWELDIQLTCRAIGTSANLMGFGRWLSHAVIGAAAIGTGGATTQMLPYNAAPAVGSNFDSTATQQVDLTATWGTSSASNSITLHGFELIACN